MKIDLYKSSAYVTRDLKKDLKKFLDTYSHKKIFIILDKNARKYCYPMIRSVCSKAPVFEFRSGEKNKTIDATKDAWKFLSEQNADRNSLVINLGGGLVCDMGGFAASTFKRGINFINIPTTLLAQVDAAIGGKTGVNFTNLKNEIGVFGFPEAIFIHTSFLKTLDKTNLLSGFGEIIKYALIFDKQLWTDLSLMRFEKPDKFKLKEIITTSVLIKNHIIKKDPYEDGYRKSLNFGHTIGHAFESFSLDGGREIGHGLAVANGMICESYLSCLKAGLKQEEFTAIVDFISRRFGRIEFSEKDIKKLIALMMHDKKNTGDKVNFTLVKKIGKAKINNYCTEYEITRALKFYRNL